MAGGRCLFFYGVPLVDGRRVVAAMKRRDSYDVGLKVDRFALSRFGRRSWKIGSILSRFVLDRSVASQLRSEIGRHSNESATGMVVSGRGEDGAGAGLLAISPLDLLVIGFGYAS